MIKIIVVGKIKFQELNFLIEYYKKQINRKIEIIEIKDESKIENIKKETTQILKNIKKDDYVVALLIEGKMLSSQNFAKFIENIEINDNKNICFIIGGSFGLEKDVLNKANFLISFSKMTFPHQLMRLILIEQIYRAYSILENHPYHK